MSGARRSAFPLVLAVVPVVAAAAAATLWPRVGLTHVTTTNTVVFEREIVGILEAHCLACHSAAGSSIPLTTYEEVWLARDRILSAVQARHMPPWAAVPGYGEFANDNGLTLRERHFLTSWVEGLGPRSGGEVFLNVPGAEVDQAVPEASVAEPRSSTDTEAWTLGEPDQVLALGQGTVEPVGSLLVERITVDPELDSERWIQGWELKAGRPQSVRAASVFLAGSGQWLGSWTPWHEYLELPAGVVHRLPAGSQLVVELFHAIPLESAERDDSQERAGNPPFENGPGADVSSANPHSLGLFLAPESPAGRGTTSELILEASATLPPESLRQRLHAETRLSEQTRVLALLPRLDAGIRTLELSARLPDGSTEILLFARDFPTEWPTPFILEEPTSLPGGTTLRATAYFENGDASARVASFSVTVSYY